MKTNVKKPIVFVGVSGGVDSSVSAALLKKAGYEVVGVFIRTWTPDFIDCTWREERRDAMRVCALLEIPFLECDAEEAYKKNVADYMIAEYKAGRTPNPDVMCNREVKFGVFYDFAMKKGADFVATGHYAQNKTAKLQKAIDSRKDQSYFLWTLTQEKLAHTLFPIGHLKKPQVRVLAKKFNLPTATKKDSQGVCFLGPLDMKDFLKHYIKSKPGVVLNQNCEEIGYHDGAIFLTLGERHGFTITKKTANDTPLYVVAKDIVKNVITVSETPSVTHVTDAGVISLENTNWIGGIPEIGKKYTAQVRYHGEYLPIVIKEIESHSAKLEFQNPVLVAPGQSIVLYDKHVCLGGGVVR